MACAPETVITVTAVNELYRDGRLGTIPHLWDTATLFSKNSFFGASLNVGGQRQLHHKTRAATGMVFAVHAAAMAQGDGLDQRQPQANATIALGRTGQAIKRLKNALTQVGGYTRAVVADPDDGLPGGLTEPEGDGAGGMAMRTRANLPPSTESRLTSPLGPTSEAVTISTGSLNKTSSAWGACFTRSPSAGLLSTR